jgi:hypothetical protein
MNNYKITIFQHLAIGLFSLTILAQNCIAAPVLCFESDGRINIEKISSTKSVTNEKSTIYRRLYIINPYL